MSDAPFRGILRGVNELPGCERPPVDGPLCDDDPLVRESAGRPIPVPQVPAGHYWCDECESAGPDASGWRHSMLWSECPECAAREGRG